MRYAAIVIALAGMATPAFAQAAGDAGQTFRARCLSCHQPPDVNLALDRAWLDQIHRTA